MGMHEAGALAFIKAFRNFRVEAAKAGGKLAIECIEQMSAVELLVICGLNGIMFNAVADPTILQKDARQVSENMRAETGPGAGTKAGTNENEDVGV